MKLPIFRPRGARRTRGQAMVEFAIILPLLALLLVMAIDAGRLFFGLVALQNASRIGANYAAGHADAWNGPPDGQQQNQRDRYQLLVQQDLQSLGCKSNVVPDPDFDLDGDGISDFDDGAFVRVSLTCSFPMLTPLAESALGGPVMLHATTDFPVNRTINTGLPPVEDPPPPVGCESDEAVVPGLVGMTMQDAFSTWSGTAFTGTFSPAVTNPNKNRQVLTQSLPESTCQKTNSSITVTHG